MICFLTKCRFLKSTVTELQNALIYLIGEFLREAKRETCIFGECSMHQVQWRSQTWIKQKHANIVKSVTRIISSHLSIVVKANKP